MTTLNQSYQSRTKIENLPGWNHDGRAEGAPETLTTYYCHNNRITKIENLPETLTTLICNSNEITKIENLPATVIKFHCYGNEITTIENLPPALTTLNCDRNRITKIENLPSSLTDFNCVVNQITKIENLPETLIYFNCSGNLIRKIENLPRGLKYVWYDRACTRYVDDISLHWWDQRGGFKLETYNIIKRLQRRIRIRFHIKNRKARIIQNACHNWLWKTKCRDGTMGIVLRLSLKKLREDGLIVD